MESPALGSTHCVRMAPGACGSEWLDLAHVCNRRLKNHGIKCADPFPDAGRPQLQLERSPLSAPLDALLPCHAELRLRSGKDIPPPTLRKPG